MTNTLEELYTLIDGQISISPSYREELCALAKAKLAILEELNQLAGENFTALLDVYTSLDGEREQMHRKKLFEAALELGMELGRMAHSS